MNTEQTLPPVARWKLKKEISVGDIIAISSAAIAVLYAYATLDKRISMIEVGIITQKSVDQRQDDEALRYQARIDQRLAEISAKLDRLIEARGIR